MAVEFWAIGSDNLVIHTVTDQATGDGVAGGTVTGVLKDEYGQPVSGADSITGVDQTGGVYHLIVEDTVYLESGKRYNLEITTVAGGSTHLACVSRAAMKFAG